ncbi:MAG: SPFH/Band 7/PHB domain protein [Proteobacteria bacterium]|nr:SPFH/Band 7/PHB domain protein [Pseudomonadota bacterium]
MVEYGNTIFLFVLLIVAVVFGLKSLQTVPQANVRLVERLGKYNRTLRPGINFIIPFIEIVLRPDISTYDKELSDSGDARSRLRFLSSARGDIPLAEIIMDPPSIDAISKDNALVYPDSIVYFRIVDPVKAVYEIENLGLALYKLIETTLRQQVGVMNADQIITGREAIGNAVEQALENASGVWGVVVTRVELEEIRFDEEVTTALSAQRAAELEGRALVAQQEREREATIIAAEAEKRKVVLEAEAKFEQERLEAEAEFLKASRALEGQAKGTEALAQAFASNPTAVVALEALKAQIEVAKAIGESNNTLIIPEETAGLFGAIESIRKITNLKLEDSDK